METNQIQSILARLEKQEGVRILYACESGSRAWGFPSADSDYDIRFIYVRPRDWYLSVDLEHRRDVIERPIQGAVDLSGWDFRKALGLFRKSNPPLLEWLNSPIVYLEATGAAAGLRALLGECYSPAACAHHYLHMARGNFREYLNGSEVWVKKYFYVLRPLLAVKWIEAGHGVAPMAFSVLVDRIITDPDLKDAIARLVEAKRRGDELDRGPMIPVITSFIAQEMSRLETSPLSLPGAAPPIEPLNDLFRSVLEEAWAAPRHGRGVAAAPETGARPAVTLPLKRPGAGSVAELGIELDQPRDFAVLGVKKNAARCRTLDTGCEVNLRTEGLWQLVPGEIAAVQPRKIWRFKRHTYLSGAVLSRRLEIPALGLVPLKLEPQGIWDPANEYWGEEGESLEDRAVPIVARGPRPSFEMEQVIPGVELEDLDVDTDPILEAAERNDAGDRAGAREMLIELLLADLRCLDAHAHLANFVFEHNPADALRHYAVGVGIGDLSLGPDFSGVLPWGHIDNRPFLRCLHGYGLALWRLGKTDDAATIFERLLWLNPTDNQGARCLLGPVRAGMAWVEFDRDRPGRVL